MLNRPLPAPAGDIALLIGRVVLGVVLFAHGCQKLMINGISGTYGQFEKLGIPLAIVSASFTSFVEFVGGALLVVGALTTTVIALDLVVMVGAAGFVHITHGIFAQDGGWELVGVIVAAELALAAAGPGRFSIDHLITSRRSQEDQRVRVQLGRGGKAEPVHHAFDPVAAVPPTPVADWVAGSWDLDMPSGPGVPAVPSMPAARPAEQPVAAAPRALPVAAATRALPSVASPTVPSRLPSWGDAPAAPRWAEADPGHRPLVGSPTGPVTAARSAASGPAWSEAGPVPAGSPARPTESGRTESGRTESGLPLRTSTASRPTGTTAAPWAQAPAPMFQPSSSMFQPASTSRRTPPPAQEPPAARGARSYVPVPDPEPFAVHQPVTDGTAAPIGAEPGGSSRDLPTGLSAAVRRTLARRTTAGPGPDPTPFGVAARSPLDFTPTSSIPVTRPPVGDAASAEYQPADTEALPVTPSATPSRPS